MPGAVPRTSTFALNHQTAPFIIELATHGLDALRLNSALQKGLSTYQGAITYQAVAEAFALPYQSAAEVLA